MCKLVNSNVKMGLLRVFKGATQCAFKGDSCSRYPVWCMVFQFMSKEIKDLITKHRPWQQYQRNVRAKLKNTMLIKVLPENRNPFSPSSREVYCPLFMSTYLFPCGLILEWRALRIHIMRIACQGLASEGGSFYRKQAGNQGFCVAFLLEMRKT